MSRIYHNTPLPSIPVNSDNWNEKWDPTIWHHGKGVILEGKVESRSRHVITDSSRQKQRYYVFHTRIDRAHRRQFDSSGKETEPNFSEMGKVCTGFLNSSYKLEAKGKTDFLSKEETLKLLMKDNLTKVTRSHNRPSCIPLWLAEEALDAVEVNDSDAIRVKTCGDSPFIESLVKMDLISSVVSNFAGDAAVGVSWTDKVMAVKSQAAETEMRDDQGDGADDDEWDD